MSNSYEKRVGLAFLSSPGGGPHFSQRTSLMGKVNRGGLGKPLGRGEEAIYSWSRYFLQIILCSRGKFWHLTAYIVMDACWRKPLAPASVAYPACDETRVNPSKSE